MHYLHACRHRAKQNNIIAVWYCEKKIITSRCLQIYRVRNFAFLCVDLEHSRLKVYVTPNAVLPRLYYVTNVLWHEESSSERLQGNVLEKETFENMRLLISVTCSSMFFVINGNITRYNDGQYSFTNLRAALSESENSNVIVKLPKLISHEQINRIHKLILHYITRNYSTRIRVSHRILVKE